MLHHSDFVKGTCSICVNSKRERDPAFRTSRNSRYRYEIRRSTQRFDDPQVSEISSAIIHARSLSRAGNVIPDPTELGSSFMPSPRGARISRLPRWGSYIVPWILCARGSQHRNVTLFLSRRESARRSRSVEKYLRRRSARRNPINKLRHFARFSVYAVARDTIPIYSTILYYIFSLLS